MNTLCVAITSSSSSIHGTTASELPSRGRSAPAADAVGHATTQTHDASAASTRFILTPVGRLAPRRSAPHGADCRPSGCDQPWNFVRLAPMGSSAPRAVRKTVTVVFADVVESTPLGERLDPELLRHVMGRWHAAMRAVLERHGGTVEEFVGD